MLTQTDNALQLPFLGPGDRLGDSSSQSGAGFAVLKSAEGSNKCRALTKNSSTSPSLKRWLYLSVWCPSEFCRANGLLGRCVQTAESTDFSTTFVIRDEDHTLGNSLRICLNNKCAPTYPLSSLAFRSCFCCNIVVVCNLPRCLSLFSLPSFSRA